MTTDVAVVGGGIVGAACAHALMKQGLRVTLIERDCVGGGATAAGMGHIVVMDDSDAQFQLTKRSTQLWDELVESMPAEVEYERRGTLWVAADERELDAVSGKLNYYLDGNVSAELLDAKALYEAEPGLKTGMAGGFLVPGDSVIYAPCAAAWLSSGANVIRQTVEDVDDGEVLFANGERLSCMSTIIATGAWATQLYPPLPVKPRKGHLAITDRYPGAVRHQLVELGYLKSAHGNSTESVAFNVQPRKTGQILIGSSRQYGVEHPAVEPHMMSKMLSRAIEYIPRLAEMSIIRTWTGFRAATPDKLPIVGLCPGYQKTWLATGHEGLGITTSLGTAELICDQMQHRSGILDPSAYRAERFPQCRA